ncbi:hypothetical protein EK21DRAFT_108846 [Setomelanomma holmii]|uniref:Uncharacterized protein n=1 Tax=Setomelanomma holmii TaxID=210430 RepID=A0A9P4HFW7_9PLEO|nr:hypothetical protein EK21DRAFT_108846 [Setomelanomma holmii]
MYEMASLEASASSDLITVTEKAANYCNKKREVFADRGDVTYIEIASYTDGTSSKSESARPADIPNWLASNTIQKDSSSPPCMRTSTKTLKLLIVPLNYKESPYSPFPDGAFEAVAKSHNLNKDYLSSEWLDSPSIGLEVPLQAGLSGFVVKAAKWNDNITHFCLSSVFDPSSMHSSCILRIATKKDLQNFKTRLDDVQEFAWYSCFLATLLIDERLKKLPDETNNMRKGLYKIEMTTGTHKKFQHRENGSIGRTAEEAWGDTKFLSAPAELTSIASDCIKRGFSCPSRRRFVAFLEGEHEANMRKCSNKDADSTFRILTQKLGFMRAWIEESESRFLYLGKRAEVQTQMCLSLMGQRDSADIKKLSDASLAISRTSRGDSANMHTIALIGLLFLPGNLIASVFSTGFFSFQGNDAMVVSSKIWLYVAIVVPLTALVLLVWYLRVYKQRREVL